MSDALHMPCTMIPVYKTLIKTILAESVRGVTDHLRTNVMPENEYVRLSIQLKYSAFLSRPIWTVMNRSNATMKIRQNTAIQVLLLKGPRKVRKLMLLSGVLLIKRVNSLSKFPTEKFTIAFLSSVDEKGPIPKSA